jgi:hypothetical protein
MSAMNPVLGGLPRINLMPRSEIDRRERDALIRRWMWGVLGAVLVSMLIIAGGFAIKWLADQRLSAEQAESNALLSELAALSEVSQSLAIERELTNFRSEALGSDFNWAPVIESLADALPSGADLTGFELLSGGVPQGEDPAAEVGLVGTVTVGSRNPIDIVATVRALRQIPTIMAADGQSIGSSGLAEGGYSYVLTVAFNQTIYSNEYAEGQAE